MSAITYEKISEACEKLITTEIRGNDYVPVNQRVAAFRMVCPDGQIETEILEWTKEFVRMKATIKDGAGNYLASGYAMEERMSSNVNKTSYVENCETSAVGRALGFCGYGIKKSIASMEEVDNANQAQEIMQQKEESKPQITAKKKEANFAPDNLVPQPIAKTRAMELIANIKACQTIEQLKVLWDTLTQQEKLDERIRNNKDTRKTELKNGKQEHAN